jgi:hypothetical protein
MTKQSFFTSLHNKCVFTNLLTDLTKNYPPILFNDDAFSALVKKNLEQLIGIKKVFSSFEMST